MARPLSDYEKRFLLAEILRTSDVPVDLLLGIIRDHQIEPRWDEMFLPPARNLAVLKVAFTELKTITPGPPPPPITFAPPAPTARKRRLSEPELGATVARTLHPKPAANGAQTTAFRSPSEPGTKKRGRPTKEVLQARRAEAAARGSHYPPLKAAGGASQGPVPGGEMSFALESPAREVTLGEASTDSPSSKKQRRGRVVREDPDVRKAMERVASAAMDIHQNTPLGDKPPEQMPVETPVVVSVQQPPPPLATPATPAPPAPPSPVIKETVQPAEREVPDSMETAPTLAQETQPSGSA